MWIKPFQASGSFYLYSAWNNIINRVSPRLFEFFAAETDSRTLTERRSVAVALGLLPDRQPSVEIFPDPMLREALGRLRREGPTRLILTVTEACNFRCRYCVFSGAYPSQRRHRSRSMPEETGIKSLRWYFAFPRKEYRISFYGGEPLLENPLIRKVVEAARKEVPPGAQLEFSMTTNGSLLDDATLEFLQQHGFHLFISLDGPAPVHDRYRQTIHGRSTFDRVWGRIRKVQKEFPDYFAEKVNFCLTLAPPGRAPEIIDFVDQNADVFGNKIPAVVTLNEEPDDLYKALGVSGCEGHVDLTLLRDRYISELAAGRTPDGFSRAAYESAMLRIARRSMTSPSPLVIFAGQCIPGIRCHVTPDGRLHSCEQSDPELPIGDVDSGYDESKIEALLRQFAALVQAHCRDCWAVRLCRKCIADIAEGGVLSPSRLASICAIRRRELERDLADYCRARAQNEHCFKTLVSGEAILYGRPGTLAPLRYKEINAKTQRDSLAQ